jgi:NAD(P)-dependent dehydrogenase (short-subunit alcohol dehydrogenase family)
MSTGAKSVLDPFRRNGSAALMTGLDSRSGAGFSAARTGAQVVVAGRRRQKAAAAVRDVNRSHRIASAIAPVSRVSPISTENQADFRWMIEVNLFSANSAKRACGRLVRSGRSLGRIATRRAMDTAAMLVATAASSYTTGSTTAVDSGTSGP